MTTIACDGKSMASDSQQTGVYIDIVVAQKIFIVNGHVIGAAGEASSGLAFVDWFRNGCNDDDYPRQCDDNSFEALVVRDGEKIKYYSSSRYGVDVGTVAAIGSGSKFAMGAMLAGADPQKAVEIACKLDPNSSEPVRVHFFDIPGTQVPL